MDSDFDLFFELLDQGYRLTSIHISVSKINGTKEEAKLTLTSEDDSVLITTSEKELFEYIIRLHPIPHIDDDDSDFMYIEDPDRYFEIQKRVFEILSGEISNLKIQDKTNDIPEEVIKRIRVLENEWIYSEKSLKVFGTSLSEIFFKVGIINVNKDGIYFDLLDKRDIKLNDIFSLHERNKKFDYSIAVSAFFLSKRHPPSTEEPSDVIIGLVEYDIINREILSFNIKTINQLFRIKDSFPRHGLWEYVDILFSSIKDALTFVSYLPLPVDVQGYTCLPWMCYCLLHNSQSLKLNEYREFNVPLLLVFGIPPIFLRRPGYLFDQSTQKAIIMFGLNEDEDTLVFHQIRFDVSKGEPNLHFHYEIIKDGKVDKILNHEVINFEDIMSFNENLGIGFLLASTYDVTFDRYIVPDRFEGIFDVYRDNPMLVYPLYARSMAGEKCRTLIKDSEKREALFNAISKPHEAMKEEIIGDLEEMGLLKDGHLTILGNIVSIRLQQMI